MKVGEVVSDTANMLISQVEDGVDGPQLEKATQSIIAEWRTCADDDRRYARLLHKLTDNLLEQRNAYSRRAAKRSGAQSDRLQHWAETINVAIQALRDRRAELKAQRTAVEQSPSRPWIAQP